MKKKNQFIEVVWRGEEIRCFLANYDLTALKLLISKTLAVISRILPSHPSCSSVKSDKDT